MLTNQIAEVAKARLLAFSALVAIILSFAGCGSDSDDEVTVTNNDAKDLHYVTNTGSATISVIDVNARKVDRTIDLTQEIPGNPSQSHFIAITKDEKYLIVGERQGSADGQILFVDLQTDKVVKKFNVGAAIGMTLSHDGRWLFSVSSNKGEVGGENYSNVINVFDVENQTYLGKINHGSNPHVLETTWDSRTLYTTTAGGGKLVAYDITGLPAIPQTPSWDFDVYQNLKDGGHIEEDVLGVTLHALAVHKNGRYVIVGSFDSPLLTGGGDVIVDVQENKIVARIPGRPHNYDISQDWKYLLSGESSNPDCEESEYLHDHNFHVEGPIVRIIDISELGKTNPDFSKIEIHNSIDAGALAGTGGINHQSYDKSGQYVIVAASNKVNGGPGHALIVKASNYEKLADLEVGIAPHGISYSGYGR